mgnify:CR=1 FL=1
MSLPNAIVPHVTDGQTVTLGVRPQTARLVLGNEPLPAGPRLRGTVETVEPDFSRRTQMAYLRSGAFLAEGDPVGEAFRAFQLAVKGVQQRRSDQRRVSLPQLVALLHAGSGRRGRSV